MYVVGIVIHLPYGRHMGGMHNHVHTLAAIEYKIHTHGRAEHTFID